MKQRTQILKEISKLKKSFAVITLAAYLLPPFASVSFARNSNAQILGNPGMVATMIAIANLNHSMRVAAENPHDEWRVQNVRHAMGLVPVALMGLAQEFKSDKLVGNDLPIVLSVLGGFVDKNAADGYKKFLQNPSTSNIPSLGSNFPQSYIQKAEAEAAQGNQGNENAAGKPADQGSALPSAEAAENKPIKGAEDLLDLGSFISQKKLQASEAASPSSVSGNEAAPKSDLQDSNNVAARGIASTPVQSEEAAIGTDSYKPALMPLRDLDSDTAEVKAEDKANAKKGEDGFFKNVGENKEKKEKVGKKRKKLRERVGVFTPISGRYLIAFAILNSFIGNKAFGGGTPPDDAPVTGAKDTATGKDKKCDGGCGGGGGGGGGGGDSSGGGAGEFLQGIAAILAAVAPIAAVAIQADADKQIAKITANSQMQMTKMAADNAKYLADQQKDLTMFQTKVAVDVADKNNQYATQRLDKQLAEMRSQRDQNFQLEKEKRTMENDYNNQRLALAQKQADAQENLNKQSLQAEIAKAGLSQGFGSKNNIPGSQKLTLTNAVASSGGQTYSAGSRATGTGAAMQQGGFSGPSLSNAVASAGAAAGGASSTGFASNTSRALAQGNSGSSGSGSGIPSLKGGTAHVGGTDSVVALNNAVQTVNSRGMALYNNILNRRGIRGTSRADLILAKQTGAPLLATSAVTGGGASAKGFLGTGRALASPSSIIGITRPIRHINPYDGSVEGGEEGGGEVIGGHPQGVSLSFSQ